MAPPPGAPPPLPRRADAPDRDPRRHPRRLGLHRRLRPDLHLAVGQLEGAGPPDRLGRDRREHGRGHHQRRADADLVRRLRRRRLRPRRDRQRPLPLPAPDRYRRRVRGPRRPLRRRHPAAGPDHPRRRQHRRHPPGARDLLGDRLLDDPDRRRLARRLRDRLDVDHAGRHRDARDRRRRLRRVGLHPGRPLGGRSRGRRPATPVAVPAPVREPELQPAVDGAADLADRRPDPRHRARHARRHPRHGPRGRHHLRDDRGPERLPGPARRRARGPMGPPPHDDRLRRHPLRPRAARAAGDRGPHRFSSMRSPSRSPR